jgi:hypothetical protein
MCSRFRQVKRPLRGEGPDPGSRSAQVPVDRPGPSGTGQHPAGLYPELARGGAAVARRKSAPIEQAIAQVLTPILIRVAKIVIRVPSRPVHPSGGACRAARPERPGQARPARDAGRVDRPGYSVSLPGHAGLLVGLEQSGQRERLLVRAEPTAQPAGPIDACAGSSRPHLCGCCHAARRTSMYLPFRPVYPVRDQGPRAGRRSALCRTTGRTEPAGQQARHRVASPHDLGEGTDGIQRERHRRQ